MGKKCCVPHCHTGYRKYNERHPMYGVPKDDFFLNKWQEAVARADRPITPNDCVCQKHFLPEDFSYRRIVKGELEEYKVPKLKPDAVPSVFPEIPDSINGTVKKRRKISLDDEQYKLQKVKKEQGEGNKYNNNSAIIDKNSQKNEAEVILCKDKIKKEEILANDNDSSQNSAVVQSDTVFLEEISIKSEETVVLEVDPGPKIYKCSQCNYSSKWPNNLQTHKIKHLEGEEHYFRCEMCPSFKTKWHTTYKNHMKTKHSLGPQEVFACTLCEFTTKIKICLKRHLERHKRGVFDRKFYCTWDACKFKSSTQEMLDTHVKQRHSKKFKCNECLFQTDFKKEITKHNNLVHSTGDYDEGNSNLTLAAATTSTMNGKKPSGVVKKSNSDFQKCTKCDFRSNSETSLMRHIFKHNYDILLKLASQKNSIESARVEESFNEFKCTECEFKCSLKCEYLKHTLMHRNISVEKLSKN